MSASLAQAVQPSIWQGAHEPGSSAYTPKPITQAEHLLASLAQLAQRSSRQGWQKPDAATQPKPSMHMRQVEVSPVQSAQFSSAQVEAGGGGVSAVEGGGGLGLGLCPGLQHGSAVQGWRQRVALAQG